MSLHIFAVGTAAAMALASSCAMAALDDASAQELMKKAGCNACHTIDKKLIGPSYHDVAQKRKGSPDVATMLEKKVREGGKGEYGQVPMPPNPVSKISDTELHDLITWVLTK